jgi:FkbM family methyltransferase
LVAASLAGVGLELRKLKSYHVDPFGDQKRLLCDEPVRVIFDLGASDGSTTLTYRPLFPDATIYSFEPTESAHEALRRRFRDDPKVVPIRAAVGPKNGTATLFVNAFGETNSLLPAAVESGSMANLATQPVPLISIDSFCAESGIAKIDVLKMDIQGFELNALKGMRNLLERRAIRLIYTEVLFARLYQDQAFYHDLAGHLQPLGYELYGIYALHLASNGALSHGDAIFMSPQVRGRLG